MGYLLWEVVRCGPFGVLVIIILLLLGEWRLSSGLVCCVGMICEKANTWISDTIDQECSSNLSLMSISSYVVRSTKETGNIY